MTGRVEAPWTAVQLANLSDWQTCGWVHPYTCGICRQLHDDDEQHALTPTRAGWICETCGYTQNWAGATEANIGPGPAPGLRTCPECRGDCYIIAVSERDRLHPDARDIDGEPLAICPTCHGDGTLGGEVS